MEGCVLVVSGRQVRLHDCKNSTVYLRCNSRPIIEDCTGIKFAPLPAVYVSPSKRPLTHLISPPIQRFTLISGTRSSNSAPPPLWMHMSILAAQLDPAIHTASNKSNPSETNHPPTGQPHLQRTRPHEPLEPSRRLQVAQVRTKPQLEHFTLRRNRAGADVAAYYFWKLGAEIG